MVVVEYTYDAWGKMLEVTGSMKDGIGSYNPFRYRGYYYDTESKLYYLQSRYYDPETGKFLNADSAAMLLSGEKAYTYCNNDPVNGSDPKGTFNSSSYISIAGWTDTILHMGLSTDGVTYYDLAYAMSRFGNSEYFENAQQLLKQNNHLITHDISPSYMLSNLLTGSFGSIIFKLNRGIANYSSNLEYELTNESFELGQLIYSQYNPGMKNFKYGLVNEQTGEFVNKKLNIEEIENGSSVICEVVALYNAMVLMGKKVLFSELLYKCQMSNYMMLGGFWGSHPGAIKSIAKEYGLTYDYTTDVYVMDGWRPSNGVIVFSYYNNGESVLEGMHTVAAQKDAKGILIYNYKPKKNKDNVAIGPFRGKKFSDKFGPKAIICAYYLYDFIEN